MVIVEAERGAPNLGIPAHWRPLNERWPRALSESCVSTTSVRNPSQALIRPCRPSAIGTVLTRCNSLKAAPPSPFPV